MDHGHRCGPLRPPPPTPAVHLVGREHDVAEVLRLLRDRRIRLVTLTGPGGVGKTSLALAAAELVQESFPDGVAVVDLTTVTDPGLLVDAVGRALGLRESGRDPMSRTVPRALRDRQVLLLLDNAEHLPASAPVTASLLAACPALRVLVTSRVPLGLPGEHELPVGPLALPDLDGPPGLEGLLGMAAVAMFVQSVRTTDPGFRPGPGAARTVAEICVRLDGLPLALELAAARVKALGVDVVLSRLQDRFRLLAAPDRLVPERHRSLRRAVDWSYDLLSEPERTLFCSLSVFSGGWELAAAEAVCPGAGVVDREDVLDLLVRLVDHSMVQVEQREGRVRYRLLETLREYAAERLLDAGQQQPLRDRHRSWFLELATRAEAALVGTEEASWLDRLEADHDNLRAALDHSEDPGADPEPGLLLAGALPRFWDVRGYLGQGCERLERLLAQQGGRVTVGRAKAQNALGTLAMARGDQAKARSALEDSARLGRRLANPRLEAWPLSMLGFQSFIVQDYLRGRTTAEQSFAIAERTQDEVLLVRSLAARGVNVWMLGDRSYGWSLLEQSVARMRVLGATWGTGNVLHLMGWLSWVVHDGAQALALEREALSLLWSLGDRHTVAHSIEVLACVAVGAHRLERGAWLLGVAAHLRHTTGGSRPPYLDPECERAAASAVAGLGSAAFDRSWSRGRDARLEDAVEAVLAQAAAPPGDDDAGHGLTRREREVASLVVRGMTNRQIAAELTISERTAERHLENVRVKLGVTSRAQIAAWTARQDAGGTRLGRPGPVERC